MRRLPLAVLLALLVACGAGRSQVFATPPPAAAPHTLGAGGPAYSTGSPAYTDIYAGPGGSDESGDGTAARPYRSLRRAWGDVQHDAQDRRTQAYRIRLLPGEYAGAYLDRETEAQFSYGTPDTPLAIESADPQNRARIIYDPLAARGNLTLFKVSYAYLQNFDIRMDLGAGGVAQTSETGDGFQCEQCDHLLLRNMVIRGFYNSNLAESMGQTETVKLNQSDHIYIEDSDIGGAGDNAVDGVAVRHGWWVRNRLHSARDWCAYLKGGSADVLVAANEITNCGTGGFVAGQGTTIVFMRAPLLQYEANNIKVINNLIHDVRGAGLGVNGGLNILIAYNTLYRVGDDENRHHMLELAPGAHDCDGPAPAECDAVIAAGGWGTSQGGVNVELVPNRNVFILNNLVYNPAGFRAPMTVFRLDGPRDAAPGVTWSGPLPARSDEGVVVRGNLIWTGTSGDDYGLGAGGDGQGCQASNPGCNPAQLAAENAINTIEPQLVDPAAGDYRPAPGGSLTGRPVAALPTLDVSMLSAAQQSLVQAVNGLGTTVDADFNGAPRSADLPGALVVGSQPAAGAALAPRVFLPLAGRG